tara:strand:+ start:720 stop:2120 length:1401 start_codon:yes stop_codon:yes gene_type:complete
MSMSGKTFLAAFQVGSRLLPDEVDRRINRGRVNLQKELLELEKDVETAKKEREKTGLKEFNEFKQGFDKLDLNNVNFPTQWKNLVSKHITGISMSPTADAMYKNIKDTVIKSEVYKASEVGTADVARAVQHWNQNNLEKITDLANLPDDTKQSLIQSHKDFLREEEKQKLSDELTLKDKVAREGKDMATFTTFLQETGSSYKPEDFNKPEARNEMRIHNQLKEVKDLAIEAGKDGVPLLKRLKVKDDGTGYANDTEIKAELQEVIDNRKTKRGLQTKSLSESQGNAFSYSERMRFDNRVIDQMYVKGLVPEDEGLEELLSSWGRDNKVDFFNVVVDPKYRQFKTAADNFIRAVLRKESGAAIAESEYKGAFRDYIPRLGDDPETVEQKRRLRLGITNVMRRVSSIPWDDEGGIPLQPLQFDTKEKAEKYFDLGYIQPGDTIEIKTDTGWQPYLVPKPDEPKPKKTP